MKRKTQLKYKLIRKDRKTAQEYEIARFLSEGDALWAATVFAAHKVFGTRHQTYVTNGKNIWYPSTKLPMDTFNIDT
jgi:hypothetical protein